ncbi:MAG: ATP-binding protein [Paludibacter sp.]
MIIHRDYRATSDSVVKVFDNYIEFYNPGKLPEEITIDDLLSGNYKSTPRNRKIADFFKNMGWIEKYGSGIGRICNLFKEEGLPQPEFRLISEGFQVTAFGRNYLGMLQKKENVPENVPENRLNSIIELIKKNTDISMLELSNHFEVNHKTIKRDIAKLKSRGILERIGPDKGGYWKVIDKTEN